ncbi:MAG: hypothetical protein ACRC2R_09105 [Xenococcaceae cyanobacterium]
MQSTIKFLGSLALVLTSIFLPSLFNLQDKTLAQSCSPLAVVDGKGTEVEKSVSPPSTGITGSNWNTDFSVSGQIKFQSYVVNIVPKKTGNYDVKTYLKYSNNTSDQIYNKTNIKLTAGEPLQIVAKSRQEKIPYQVNVLVGGLEAIGNSYTVSVQGCR